MTASSEQVIGKQQFKSRFAVIVLMEVSYLLNFKAHALALEHMAAVPAMWSGSGISNLVTVVSQVPIQGFVFLWNNFRLGKDEHVAKD